LSEYSPVPINLFHKELPIGEFKPLPFQKFLSFPEMLDFDTPFTVIPLDGIEIGYIGS